MKNTKVLILLFSLFLISGITSAQKFGKIDTQQLLALMPETKTAQADLEKYVQEIRDQLDIMQVEYNTKLKEYQDAAKTYSEIQRELKEKELSDIYRRTQEFEQSASEKIQAKQMELMGPIRDKANKAIEDVIKENGFILIYDPGAGVIFGHPEKVEDCLPLVKKKLGIL